MSKENNNNTQAMTLYTKDDYSKVFDPMAYLTDFYSKTDNEPAMLVMLRFLPNVAWRMTRGCRLLDIGSGPTVHVAMCFRNTVEEIYLSDYVEQNRNAIEKWRTKNEKFDWSNVSKFIATLEGSSKDDWEILEDQARQKVKGVLCCDIFLPGVVPNTDLCQFDVVTTIFCLEYASNNSQEYQTAVKNVVDLIRPGGYFVMGGVLEETWYQFGGKRYSCHYLTEDEMLSTLKLNKIDVDDRKTFQYLHHEGIFLIVGRKIA